MPWSTTDSHDVASHSASTSPMARSTCARRTDGDNRARPGPCWLVVGSALPGHGGFLSSRCHLEACHLFLFFFRNPPVRALSGVLPARFLPADPATSVYQGGHQVCTLPVHAGVWTCPSHHATNDAVGGWGSDTMPRSERHGFCGLLTLLPGTGGCPTDGGVVDRGRPVW